MQRLIFIAILATLLALGGLAGCAGSQTKADKTAAQQAPQHPAPQAVQAYMLGRDVPMILKVRPDQWSELSGGLSTVTSALPLPGSMRRLIETVDQQGPFRYWGDKIAGYGPMEGLDPTRAVYIGVGYVGDEQYLRAAGVGLPTPPQSQMPVGIQTRLLIPSDDPEALAESIRSNLPSDPPGAMQTATPAGTFVRVENLYPARRVASRERAEAVFEQMSATAEAPTLPAPTEAMRAFIEADAPGSVYLSADGARRFFINQSGLEMAVAARGASPENVARLFMAGTQVVQGISLFSPRSARSFEDFMATIDGDGEDGVVVEATATRTAHGAELWKEGSASGQVAAFSKEATPEEDLLLDAAISYDAAGVGAAAGGDLFTEGEDAPLGRTGDVANYMRSSGLGGYYGMLHSPEHFAGLLARTFRQSIGLQLPSHVRLRVVEGQVDGKPGLKGGFRALVDLGESGAARTEAATRIRMMLDRLDGVPMFDVNSSFEQDEGRGEVSVGLNLGGGALLSEESEPYDRGIGLALAIPKLAEALQTPGRRLPGLNAAMIGRMLDGFPPLALTSATGKSGVRLRLYLGGGELDGLEAPDGGELRGLEETAGCLDGVTAGATRFADALSKADPFEKKYLEGALDEIDEAVEGCEGSGVAATDREWFRARARWVVGWRTEQAADSTPEEMADERQKGVTLARSFYQKACELGDEAGCRAAKALKGD